MDYLLDPIEVRVLGSLIEKQISTPDYYPLTFNSLLAACNQKTSRNPVTDYNEKEVMSAIDGLCEKGLAVKLNIAGSRVEKFRHRMSTFAELSDKELVLLCVLMLRGLQTAGELRQRSEGLYPFVDIAETKQTLKGLMECEDPEPLVSELPLEPGRKERRYVHLFSEIPAVDISAESIVSSPRTSPSQVQEKLDQLEQAFEELREVQEAMSLDIKVLREQLEAFKNQFE